MVFIFDIIGNIEVPFSVPTRMCYTMCRKYFVITPLTYVWRPLFLFVTKFLSKTRQTAFHVCRVWAPNCRGAGMQRCYWPQTHQGSQAFRNVYRKYRRRKQMCLPPKEIWKKTLWFFCLEFQIGLLVMVSRSQT